MPVDAPEVTPTSEPVTVVGIGVSAGSLDPLRAFLAGLPAEPGMAFFVITHHPPSQPSLLPELLADRSPLPVREAIEGLAVAADHVYVARPGGDWLLRDGKLVQQTPEGESGAAAGAEKSPGPPHPVDTFFRSLAAEQAFRSVAILLSGTGSDGTLGIKVIHSQGGMVMAQDPETADFDGMPARAIATGMVDYALHPPGDMPAALVAYGRTAAEQRTGPG
ncbi:chemotaxis protein CheB [Thiohalorhabdus sp.]|uniref:chemotaxis protein CheB n=1 Tax=Thiohalorhabdus sp. TaxID=3094134 RepID=UPI002FC38D3B